MNRYLCPVCFYPDLDEPPGEFNICPCCGTEFGVDDYVPGGDPTDLIYRELRWRWLENGATWFDPGTLPPQSWSGFEQVWSSAVWLRASPAGLRTTASMAAPALRVTIIQAGDLMGARVLSNA